MVALSLNNAQMPLGDAIARPSRQEFIDKKQLDPKAGLVTQPWIEYFTILVSTANNATTRANTVSLTGQSASISATDFSGAALDGGLYYISYYARITVAAGTNSSLTITFDWTEGGVSGVTFSGTAITGNTTTTMQGDTKLIRVDGASPVRYSTTYASSGVPSMEYKVDFVLSKVQT